MPIPFYVFMLSSEFADASLSSIESISSIKSSVRMYGPSWFHSPPPPQCQQRRMRVLGSVCAIHQGYIGKTHLHLPLFMFCTTFILKSLSSLFSNVMNKYSRLLYSYPIIPTASNLLFTRCIYNYNTRADHKVEWNWILAVILSKYIEKGKRY